MSQNTKTSAQKASELAARIRKLVELIKAIAEAAAGNWASLIKIIVMSLISIILPIFIFTTLLASSLFEPLPDGRNAFDISPEEFTALTLQSSIIDYVTQAYEEASKEMVKKINREYSYISSFTTDKVIINPLENAEIMEMEIYKVYSMFEVYNDRMFLISGEQNSILSMIEQSEFFKLMKIKELMRKKFDSLLSYTVSTETHTHYIPVWDNLAGKMVDSPIPIYTITFTYTISVSDVDEVGPLIFDLADRTGDTSLPEGARIDEIKMAKYKAMSLCSIFGAEDSEFGGDAEMSGLGTRTGQTTFVSQVDYSMYINNYSVQNVSFTPSIKMPVPLLDKYKLSSVFGERVHPIKKVKRFHTGIDLSAAGGTNIYSIANGVVVKTGYNNGYGNFIIVYHGEINGSHYFTTYNHMKESAPVKAGQEVTTTTVIGRVGSTGLSTGPHLHFEVRVGTVDDKGSYSFLFVSPSLFLDLQ